MLYLLFCGLIVYMMVNVVEVFKVVGDFDDVIMIFGVVFVVLWFGVGDFI